MPFPGEKWTFRCCTISTQQSTTKFKKQKKATYSVFEMIKKKTMTRKTTSRCYKRQVMHLFNEYLMTEFAVGLGSAAP